MSKEFKERFPNKHLVQLKAILEHVNLSLNSLPPLSIQAKPFGVKGFDITDARWIDGFYDHVPEAVVEWTSSFLADFSGREHSLAEFFVDCCRLFIEKQKNAVPTSPMDHDFGSMLLIQIMLRQHEVRQYINMTEAVLMLINSYPQLRSNHSIGNTVLWIIVQTRDDVISGDDMAAWFSLCLPAFDKMATCSSASFQVNSISLFETRLMDLIGDRLHVDPRNVVKILHISQVDDSILKSTERGLELLAKLKAIFGAVRDSTLKQSTREKQYVFQQMYDRMSNYQPDTKVFHEASTLLLDLLRDDRALFAVWETKFHERPEITLRLLNFLNAHWTDYFSGTKYDFSYFTRFIKTVAKTATSREDQKIVRELMKKTTSNLGLIFLSLIIALFAVVFVLVHMQDFDFFESLENALAITASVYKHTEHHIGNLFELLISIYNNNLRGFFSMF